MSGILKSTLCWPHSLPAGSKWLQGHATLEKIHLRIT